MKRNGPAETRLRTGRRVRSAARGATWAKRAANGGAAPVARCANRLAGRTPESPARSPIRRRPGDYGYCRSTVKRLIEYPSAPPMKTSDKKWADRESLEKPTSAAMPYAAYGTQR